MKWIQWSLFGLVSAVALFLAFVFYDAPPRGEGSYKRGDEIYEALGSIDLKNPEESDDHYMYGLGDGGWYIITGDNSHDSSYNITGNGGTIGVLTSDGGRYIFFGHVCGPGSMPFGGFGGSNKGELLASLRDRCVEYVIPTNTDL